MLGGLSLLLLFGMLASQLNGDFGACLADVSRAVLGAQATAQIESWLLGIEDTLHKAQYQIFGVPAAAPWAESSASKQHPQQSMLLVPMTPVIQPALPGEGVWTSDNLPTAAPGQPPVIAKAYLRPDPSRPYAVVTFLQFDLRALNLHLVAGTAEPGGPLSHYGTGKIPGDAQTDASVVAAFNGGFKYADGHYGLMTDGRVYVPSREGAATIAETTQGQVILDTWGHNPQLSLTNQSLTFWRQNAAMLIDHGQLNPLTSDGADWGGVWLNKAYTWRSALGLTNHQTLIYAAGDSLSAATIGKALLAAGATMGMQTDINPKWVRAFLYVHTPSGTLKIQKLDPGMQGTGTEYFQTTERDFFYVTLANPVASTTPTMVPPAPPIPVPTTRPGER